MHLLSEHVSSRRALLRWLPAGAACAALPSWAQGQGAGGELAAPALSNYRFIVGFGAGGVPDAAARLIAATMSERWKLPAIVENKTGVGGTLAAKAVLASPADGSTLLSVSPAHATAPAVFANPGYDTLRDFAPVTMIGDGPALVVAPKNLPAANLAEMLAQARSRPGSLSYSSAGVGSSSHFAAALLCQQAGIEGVNIPYKSVGEAMTETIAGRVQFHIAPYVSAMGMVKEGRVRALAVTSPRRIAEMPDVPTTAEAGVPGYEWSFWYGLLASARTPAAVVAQLNKDITGILRLPQVKKQLEGMGVNVSAGTSAEFGRLIEAEVTKYRRIAKAAGMAPL
ncbi:tripartite-type tricarboxylate transporter receptor subunit TctC [Variovorax paradoxus]|uniref:tripartite tricarboxylate transporter substrate binding protein n=1 Tax=Variovorax atrisoli TaxID=3394203 RepID=UPI001199CE17|nr:tripartite tricarboxylate transporter substrate binding protein [Variovorax paradoxus]MDR6522415.1 tripartite-type tricarboxylate transporter receptor subunit TctC [Variovorax paradoxus]